MTLSENAKCKGKKEKSRTATWFAALHGSVAPPPHSTPTSPHVTLRQLTAVGNGDGFASASTGRPVRLNLLYHIHTLRHLSKHNVLAIQPWGVHGAKEELTAVGAGAGIGHGEDAGASVLQNKVLISCWGEGSG